MAQPTREFIYAPSQSTKQITEAEFLERYADHSWVILVSFAEDGVSTPERVTAYMVTAWIAGT